MDWLQVLTIVASTVGAVAFFQRNAKSDHKELKDIVTAMQTETKDFHGRLCKLEERYIQLMQRIWEKGNE